MRLITLSLFATLLSAPAFAADLGTYRPGTPYSSSVAGGADVCESHCAGDAQCRGWNYVKPNPRVAGICEFLSSVSSPIASSVSISGESQANSSFSSRVTPGGTNTVRVGTQFTPPQNIVRVGGTALRRTVVRQTQPDRIVPQKTSTRPRAVENLSLTEQQNRYRQAQGFAASSAPQPQSNQGRAPQQQARLRPQRPNFRPILDGVAPQVPPQIPGQNPAQVPPQLRQQPQVQPVQRQTSRRVTGPRQQRAPQGAVQGTIPGQGFAAPQFQDPRVQQQNSQRQNPQGQIPQGQGFQGQNFRGQNFRGQPHPPTPAQQAPQGQPQPFTQQQAAARRGSSRPPIGEPIQAPQKPVQPKPSTPSQRLAQFTAQTKASPITGPVAVNPEQARTSLYGRLNDDLGSRPIPTASAVPTQPVSEQPLGEVLAGGR